MAYTTTSDLYVAWGVEADRELCYVEAGGVGREYVIDNDTDFQIDLFDAGLSALQIREVMADVRMNRLRAAECPCYIFDEFANVAYEISDYPRAECARPEERPPGSARSSQGCGRGFSEWFYLSGGCVAWALIFWLVWRGLR